MLKTDFGSLLIKLILAMLKTHRMAISSVGSPLFYTNLFKTEISEPLQQMDCIRYSYSWSQEDDFEFVAN